MSSKSPWPSTLVPFVMRRLCLCITNESYSVHPHLQLSSSSAQLATDRARRRYERATADMRHAVRLSFVMAILASALLASGRTSLALVGAVGAGLCVIVALSWRRAQKRERSLWWHQARSGLVDALAEQREQNGSDKTDDHAVIIDLRDHRPHGVVGKDDKDSVEDDSTGRGRSDEGQPTPTER